MRSSSVGVFEAPSEAATNSANGAPVHHVLCFEPPGPRFRWRSRSSTAPSEVTSRGPPVWRPRFAMRFLLPTSSWFRRAAAVSR